MANKTLNIKELNYCFYSLIDEYNDYYDIDFLYFVNKITKYIKSIPGYKNLYINRDNHNKRELVVEYKTLIKDIETTQFFKIKEK